jgi:hypothetical protein
MIADIDWVEYRFWCDAWIWDRITFPRIARRVRRDFEGVWIPME